MVRGRVGLGVRARVRARARARARGSCHLVALLGAAARHAAQAEALRTRAKESEAEL